LSFLLISDRSPGRPNLEGGPIIETVDYYGVDGISWDGGSELPVDEQQAMDDVLAVLDARGPILGRFTRIDFEPTTMSVSEQARHRRIIREAVALRGGYLVPYEGQFGIPLYGTTPSLASWLAAQNQALAQGPLYGVKGVQGFPVWMRLAADSPISQWSALYDANMAATFPWSVVNVHNNVQIYRRRENDDSWAGDAEFVEYLEAVKQRWPTDFYVWWGNHVHPWSAQDASRLAVAREILC